MRGQMWLETTHCRVTQLFKLAEEADKGKATVLPDGE